LSHDARYNEISNSRAPHGHREPAKADAPPFGVSVLLPVFFKEHSDEQLHLLRRAIHSIAIQRFPSAYEVLLIDDGSWRPVANVIPELPGGLPLRVIRLEVNTGIAGALNRGLAEAKYPFIARLDYDDCWLATKIEKQLDLFARDPDLTIVGTGMILVTLMDELIETHIRPSSWEWCLQFIAAGGSPFPHSSVVARRDIYQALGGYPADRRFIHCEDYALWADWLRFFKPAMLEESLLRYTVSPYSVSVAARQQQIEGSLRVRERLAGVDYSRIPLALHELARVSHRTLIESGLLAFRMWRVGAAIALPSAAAEPLAQILPDREVQIEGPRFGGALLKRMFGRHGAPLMRAVLR
jgi:hypothetical protein